MTAALLNSYPSLGHGPGVGLLSIPTLPASVPCALAPFLRQGFGYHHALNPDPYRGPFGDDGPRYAADVADLISSATPGQVAGFVAETIQGVGGAVPLATGYLPAVYKVGRVTPGKWGRREGTGGVVRNRDARQQKAKTWSGN